MQILKDVSRRKAWERKRFQNALRGAMSDPLDLEPGSLQALASYKIRSELWLSIALGSVVDFASAEGAIVSAGTKLDLRIAKAGGKVLKEDWQKLQSMKGTRSAGMTGPNDYGRLKVPYVIHVDIPKFSEIGDANEARQLLRAAYKNSLSIAEFRERSKGCFQISQVALPVLGTGGKKQDNTADIFEHAVEAIVEWCSEDGHWHGLSDIVLCVSTSNDADNLTRVCDETLEGFFKVFQL
jgi:O-acetyl-ADP-ribose deacetylase (regulator of RNase III)